MSGEVVAPSTLEMSSDDSAWIRIDILNTGETINFYPRDFDLTNIEDC